MIPTQKYNKKCYDLGGRILRLIPQNPKIMSITNAFDLFKIPGFECSDLKPSLAQAIGALSWAKSQYRLRGKNDNKQRT